MKIKRISIICLIVMIINIIPASAYEIPHAFWAMNEKYQQACTEQNYGNIIYYGQQITDLIEQTEDSAEKKEILISRYQNIGVAQEKLARFDDAAVTFQKLYDCAYRYEEFKDYTKGAKAKILQYKSTITMYTDKGTSPYYDAVNEKGNGVLFGLCMNGETRSQLKNESMVLTYQELGQSLMGYNRTLMRDANKEGFAVEFALNCPREGTDIRNVRKMESYLEEISNLFAEYPNVPVYLRFAAEFDVWENPAEPQDFREAFRYVSKYFKDRHDNVALVWSPNQVSSWDIDIDDYYPGDRYVDWVGMSLYAQRYFLGDKYQDKNSEIIFRTGINSDPVLAVKEIVEKYGSKKPIMISESGCGHKIVRTGEDSSEFALQRLKEYYSYLPMVYPQIKLMAYFDWHVNAATEKNDYRLSTNKAMQTEYLNLVKGSRFIQDKYTNDTGYCNRPIYNGISLDNIFELSCYAHLYGAKVENVSYFIDGEYVGMSTELPFTTIIDATKYAGKHKLKANAVFDNGEVLTTESNVIINNISKDITVEISNKEIRFDQDPIAYNSRTMVPMRKIFEELGAKVTWDPDTQTAIGKKGDRTVKITLGHKTMYVNNKEIALDTAPIALSGRVLVPVRAIAEGLGCDVDWDGKNSVVSITPKVARWSEWDEELPDDIDEDLYYIDEKTEYRLRTREKERFRTSDRISAWYVDEEVSYGNWSNWTQSYISSSSSRQVETRTRSTPMQYHYAHYCTGYYDDESIRYKTSRSKFSDKCSYHDLGWYDWELSPAPDGAGYILYNNDGSKYRCSNTCYRWYVVDTVGGEYTEYRSRPVYVTYIYERWGDWSRWSSWDDEDPYEYDYAYGDDSVEVEQRTMYRYKEK